MGMPRGICVLTVAAILASSGTSSIAEEGRLAGYLFDRNCADNMKSQRIVPDQSHKKECALNSSCSKDGYSVYSKGQWYQFDKKGNELARQLLETTKTSSGHFVVVKGNIKGGEIQVVSLNELAKQD